MLAREAVVILVTTCLFPAKVHADDFRAVLGEVSYAKPVRFNVGGSLFFSPEDVAHSDGGSGIIVGGRVGLGGMELWGGKAVLAEAWGADIRAVVTRTWETPRGAAANSTYVGGEVGLGWIVRLSVGYAKRISGPSPAADHIVTWGGSVGIPWFR